MRFRYIFLFFLFTLATSAVTAQVFPVQVSLSIAPPYTPYLSDYAAPEFQHFIVQITLNDRTVSDYRCRLRLTIEGSGTTIRSKDDYAFTPLVLNSGGQVFYGHDLHEYFRPEALTFNGLSRTAYGHKPRLPEGLYRFTIEVLDYNRGTAVSNRGTATVWIMLNDPPLLNQPANLSTVALQDPTNLLFTWTPRHTHSPNAAFNTVYTFRLVELWPDDRNPNDALLTLPPIYEATTTATQLLYGPTAPALLPGKRYAWQVQAIDESGRDLFRNEGRSEVFVFQHGEALPIPANLRMRWAKPTTLAIRWDPVQASGDVRYRLQYRPRRRSPDQTWYETWTRFTDKTLYHLEANTDYEMRIRSENALTESDYSEIQVFRTLREEADAFVCRDDIPPPPLPEESLPVFPLSINDTIHAGGYDVVVRDVFRNGSRYSGAGLAIVPWLNQAKVRVTFENIRLNQQFWLTTGSIKSFWDSESRFHLEQELPHTPGDAPKVGELDVTIASVDSLVTIEGSVIAAVTKNEDGNIVVTKTDGDEQVIPKGQSVAVVDEMGNGYVVDEKGQIAKTTATEARAAAERGSSSYDIALAFSRGPGRFGFDEKRYDAVAQYYQQLDGERYASWKALSTASPDVLRVSASGGLYLKDITFESGGLRVVPASIEGDAATLQLLGKAAGLEEALIAFHADDSLSPRIAGRINLATYDPAHYNLVIVPVNGAQLPHGLNAEAIAQRLNEVYGQAVVQWSVTASGNLDVAVNKPFDDRGMDAWSVYTDDMKKVIRAYGPMQDNTWYLFVVQTPGDPSTLGYMPRNRRAGFLFTDPHRGDAENFLKTIAHELGHGVFNLRHTFDEHALPAGGTDNLMDYSDGTALFKYQWDYIHEPRKSLGLFDGSEAGALRHELADFFDEAAPALEAPEYKAWVEKVRTVYEFLKACHEEGWESYNGRGIFPHCFWRDQIVPPGFRFTTSDLPFIAGLVDGGYVEMEGIYKLPEAVREVSKFPGKLLYSYTIAYWRCRPPKLQANQEEYEYVIGQLAEMEREGGLWNWVKEQWYDYEGDKEQLEAYFATCREAEELRYAVEDLYELATHWEQIVALSEEVTGYLKNYWDELDTSTNHGRYEIGALVVPTASLFLPLGVGVGSKAEKFKAILRLLGQLSKDNLNRVARNIGDIVLTRKASGADDWVKRISPERVSNLVHRLPLPAGKFQPLTGRGNATYRAEAFWKQEHGDFRVVMSADDRYLVKHDPETGRVLFADLEQRKFLSFGLDEDGLVGDDYATLFSRLKTIHGLPGGARSLTVRGTTIPLSSERANILLGKYKPNEIPGISGEVGTADIIDELGILKSYPYADEAFELRPGSVHVLNVPDQMVANAQDFFLAYNKPFLDKVLSNPERVRVMFVTDPRNTNLLRRYREGLPMDFPSTLGQEVKYFQDHGFGPIYLRDGTPINIQEINLNTLIWR